MNSDQKLDLVLEKLDEHSSILNEHSKILSTLIHGQEEIKANVEGFKIETSENFDVLNAKFDLLEKRTFTNETDIHRLIKIVGIE